MAAEFFSPRHSCAKIPLPLVDRLPKVQSDFQKDPFTLLRNEKHKMNTLTISNSIADLNLIENLLSTANSASLSYRRAMRLARDPSLVSHFLRSSSRQEEFIKQLTLITETETQPRKIRLATNLLQRSPLIVETERFIGDDAALVHEGRRGYALILAELEYVLHEQTPESPLHRSIQTHIDHIKSQREDLMTMRYGLQLTA